jgi:23S rRNA (uracil1939-C5)-methyltransferase
MSECITIDRLGHRGDGIADSPGGALFVPYTLPGETVEVELWPGHPDRRQLMRVDRASAERIAPICQHFGVCGGCALQHWDGAHYRAWKRGLVVEALAQSRLEVPVADLIEAHGAGRRRATFHVRQGTHDVVEVGFAALKAHHIVAIDRCPILADGLTHAIEAAWAIAETLMPIGKPLDIQATATQEGLDIDVRGSGPLAPARTTALAGVAERHRLARLTRHGELISQRATPSVMMGRARVVLPPGSFLQATAAGEDALAALVNHHSGGARRIADLFAGVGPFALRLAERARITAADSNEAAITALRRAADAIQGLKPIDAQTRDLFNRPFVQSELKTFDCVLFDPPRQGAHAQARELAAAAVPVVIAVSCNVATFVRDARLLVEGGYRLIEVTPIDQFLYSPHVEIVARFEK